MCKPPRERPGARPGSEMTKKTERKSSECGEVKGEALNLTCSPENHSEFGPIR